MLVGQLLAMILVTWTGYFQTSFSSSRTGHSQAYYMPELVDELQLFRAKVKSAAERACANSLMLSVRVKNQAQRPLGPNSVSLALDMG